MSKTITPNRDDQESKLDPLTKPITEKIVMITWAIAIALYGILTLFAYVGSLVSG